MFKAKIQVTGGKATPEQLEHAVWSIAGAAAGRHVFKDDPLVDGGLVSISDVPDAAAGKLIEAVLVSVCGCKAAHVTAIKPA